MSGMLIEPVSEPSAWRREDLERDRGWRITLDTAQRAELSDAVELNARRGLRAADFAREDFALPRLAPVLAQVLDAMEHGRGVALLRGLPVRDDDDEHNARLLWGVGLYLGRALPQHARVNLGGFRDDLIATLVDQGLDYSRPEVHGAQTGAAQKAHCDPSDLVALLCVRPAASGGVSRIVSATAVYNEILRTRPDLLAPLYRGYRHYLRKLVHEGAGDGLTPAPIPVFSYHEGRLSCNFNTRTVQAGVQVLERPLPGAEQQALDYMVALTESEALYYDMDLAAGDLQVLNNYTILHARTGWSDPPDLRRRRMMLRLWLKAPNARALAPGFAGGYVSGSSYDVATAAY